MKVKKAGVGIVIISSFLLLGLVNARAEGEQKGIFDPDNFSASAALTTDYVFRGISQTDEEPTIQGSFDYAHPSGIYIGVWGSGVDEAVSKGNVELDYYAGYGRELFKDFSFDLSFIYYNYPGGGDNPEPDYFEVHLGLAYKLADLPLSPSITAGYNYSPDFFGEDGNAHYVNGLLELSLPYEFILAGEVGYQDVEGEETTGKGQGEGGGDGFDYIHWRVGLSKGLLGFTLDLSYHDTNEEDFLGEIGDERVVFTVSRSF